MDTRLPRALPHEVGLNAASIQKFVEEAQTRFGIHGFEVLRHGKVAAAGWWKPYREEDVHVLFSMSKTFTATAVGIAAGEGLLSLDDRVVSFFPEKLSNPPCAYMQQMQVRHLLNMATGHETEPVVLEQDNPKSWVETFLTSYVEREPGSWWCYNTPATYLLSAIVQKVSGQLLSEYLKPRLFAPLGIDTYWWEQSPEGIETGGYGLNTRLESLTKLGLLYLQDGVWEGKRLLPAGWAKELGKNRITTPTAHHPLARLGYGYQVWACPAEDSFRGDGAFGQFMAVLPKQDLVIAIHSGEALHLDVLQLALDCILPTLDQPSAPEEEAALAARCASLVRPIPAGAAFSPMALRVSGKWYAFAPNRLGLQALRVTFGETPSLSLKVGEEISTLPLGFGCWAYGTTEAPEHAPSLGTFLFREAACCYRWEGETLILTVAFHKTTYVDTWRLSFDRFGVVATYARNVSFGERLETLYGRPEQEDSERYAWKATVKEGKLAEYCRRHDAIWPELKAVLKEAGIKNYTIWNVGQELFGYYECEKGAAYAARVQAESPVVDRWNEYMKDVMEMELDPETGAQPLLRQVFLLE